MRVDLAENVTLYCGDCLTVLRDMDAGSVNAVVTDPPYGIANLTRYGNRGNAAIARTYQTIVNDDKPFDPRPFLKFPTVILFGANWFAHLLPSSGGWIVWDKRDGMPSNDFSDAEMAWVNDSNVVRLIHHRWNGMIRASEQGEPRIHSSQKPVWVMRWIIENYTDPGDLILDPFMGSGTTIVAAIQTGRRAIGIEIDEGYFAIARRRIEDTLAQPHLIPPAMYAAPTQAPLLEIA